MKYEVDVVIPVYLSIKMEAKSKEDAIEAAMDRAYLTGYAGNGSSHGKLIGTSDPDVMIYPGDDVLEGEINFEITANLIES